MTELLARLEPLESAPLEWPIFIPSRGRAGSSQAAKMFGEHDVPFTMVVEPQEAATYRDVYPEVVVLPESDRGIAYARNYILDHAAEQGLRYCWQFDDNVQALMRRTEVRRRIHPRSALAAVEALVGPYDNIGAACFLSHAFDFTHQDKPPVIVNGMVYCAELLRTDTGIRFKPDSHEDVDFSLQTLDAGWVTLVTNRLVHSKPTSGTQKGGNTDSEYREDGRLRRFERLMEDWPDTFNLQQWPDGRYRCIPKPGTWKQFAQQPGVDVVPQPRQLSL